MKMLYMVCSVLVLLLVPITGITADFDTNIPMRNGGASTFYIEVQVGDLQQIDFMVDTGSGYITINEQTLTELQEIDQASYQRNLQGVLADGTEINVPVYRLSSFNIGGGCLLSNVDAAVFPGKTRQILGLNALKMAGPFIFSFDPPKLVLSNCVSSATEFSSQG